MNTNTSAIRAISPKTMLSTLWLFAMLNFAYGDVVTLMDSTQLKQYLTGDINGVHLSPSFLLASSIMMEIPIAMILFSRILNYGLNRWLNVIAGTIWTVITVATLFKGSPTQHYVFFSAVEIVATLCIVVYAWRMQESDFSS